MKDSVVLRLTTQGRYLRSFCQSGTPYSKELGKKKSNTAFPLIDLLKKQASLVCVTHTFGAYRCIGRITLAGKQTTHFYTMTQSNHVVKVFPLIQLLWTSLTAKGISTMYAVVRLYRCAQHLWKENSCERADCVTLSHKESHSQRWRPAKPHDAFSHIINNLQWQSK